MKNYFKLDENGIPTPAKDDRDFWQWVVKNSHNEMTLCFTENGMPVEILTSFNYREGIFKTFKLEGESKTELGISDTKEKSVSIHKKHVDLLTNHYEN